MTQAREEFERRRDKAAFAYAEGFINSGEYTADEFSIKLDGYEYGHRAGRDAGITDPLVLELVRAATDEIVSRVNQHWPRSKTEIALHEAITRYESAIKVE